jgi:hypothetical protein
VVRQTEKGFRENQAGGCGMMRFLTMLCLILCLILPSAFSDAGESPAADFTVDDADGKDAGRDAAGGGIICHRDGVGFVVPVPEGWIADKDAGQQAGVCAFLYHREKTYNTATSVIFPQILPTPAGADPVDEMAKYSLLHMSQMNPEGRPSPSIRPGPDSALPEIPGEDGKRPRFQTRYFDDIPWPQKFQLVAYLVDTNMTLLLVLSTGTKEERAVDESILRDIARRTIPIKIEYRKERKNPPE